jgi:hypothetical protein
MSRKSKNAPAEMPSNRPVRRYSRTVQVSAEFPSLIIPFPCRLRVDANNSVKKTVDPRYTRCSSSSAAHIACVLTCSPHYRFTDVSGKLDERIFNKNYAFLDEYRDNEIEVLSKAVKKVKSANKKDEIKSELLM